MLCIFFAKMDIIALEKVQTACSRLSLFVLLLKLVHILNLADFDKTAKFNPSHLYYTVHPFHDYKYDYTYITYVYDHAAYVIYNDTFVTLSTTYVTIVTDIKTMVFIRFI